MNVRMLGAVGALVLLLVLSASGPASADAAFADKGDIRVLYATASDADGNGADVSRPTVIGRHLEVSIVLMNLGEDAADVVVRLIPSLNGYSVIQPPLEGDLPAYDPSTEIDLSRAMDELYEVFPARGKVIEELKAGERTTLNFTIAVRTAGAWNCGILITLPNGTSYLYHGSTFYVARNLTPYLDAMVLAIPFATGGGALSIVHLCRRRRRMGKGD